jgi:ABC-type polysaccharide/polyol phosphate transport system ATPase subunit
MLGQDINKPLYAYSSGMKLRLSVSISLATIDKHLVIDEWFGAGDKYFGKKLEQGLERVIKNDGTLITSSHNMNLLRRICNTGIYINNGKLMFMGTIDDTIRMYNEET